MCAHIQHTLTGVCTRFYYMHSRAWVHGIVTHQHSSNRVSRGHHKHIPTPNHFFRTLVLFSVYILYFYYNIDNSNRAKNKKNKRHVCVCAEERRHQALPAYTYCSQYNDAPHSRQGMCNRDQSVGRSSLMHSFHRRQIVSNRSSNRRISWKWLQIAVESIWVEWLQIHFCGKKIDVWHFNIISNDLKNFYVQIARHLITFEASAFRDLFVLIVVLLRETKKN